MEPFTPTKILLLLLFYAGLFLIISLHGLKLTSTEKKTFIFLWISGFIVAMVANYLLYRAGVMSFLPWINNFLHTFFWIGIGFPYLYLGIRGRRSVLAQYIMFVVFSLIVKYAEQRLFGTWEFPHFFFVLKDNFFYILGWSTVDGLYPVLIPAGLRLAGKFIPGLVLS
ncbi:MAG: hypothetical protein ABI647_09710 [Gemmatimonadota bacterium]